MCLSPIFLLLFLLLLPFPLLLHHQEDIYNIYYHHHHQKDIYSIYYMPDMVLSILHTLNHIILITLLAENIMFIT